MRSTRRIFVAAAVLAPLAALAGPATAADARCGGELPLSQKNRRRALSYVEPSGDAKRRCGLCTYFSAEAGPCGACQMLSGNLVSQDGLCNAFVPRPN